MSGKSVVVEDTQEDERCRSCGEQANGVFDGSETAFCEVLRALGGGSNIHWGFLPSMSTGEFPVRHRYGSDTPEIPAKEGICGELFLPTIKPVDFGRTSRVEQMSQQRRCVALIQHLIRVPALRRNHAGRAAVFTRAPPKALEGLTEPRVCHLIASVGESGACGESVVDEDRRQAGVWV